MVIFSPQAPSQSGLAKHRAVLSHYSPFTLMVIACLWIQLAACACASLWTVHRLCRVRQLAISYLSAPALYCMLPATSALCFGAYKIHTNVNPSAFTSRACPCGVVSNMAPDRPALDVGAFWLLLPRLCWEDPFQLGLVGNINTFISEMWREDEKIIGFRSWWRLKN